jgi:hypothetical protein
MPPERPFTSPMQDSIAPPPPPAELAARRTQEVVMSQWAQLSHQQVIPSPLGQTAVDSLELKPRKLDADRKKERDKKRKKRVIHEWRRSLWLRRALANSKDKAEEKSKDKDKSKTARGLWKLADVAIGLALTAPNRTMTVPGNKSNSYRRYGPVRDL